MITISSFEPLYQFVILSLIIIGIVRCLKWKGIFTDSDQPVFDKLVTELAVPAVIFSIFVTADFSRETLFPAGILFSALIFSLCIAYGICLLFHFPPKMTGTLVMVSGFGSTATMAGPLLSDLFRFQSGMVEQGLTIGTIGVALPFFTLGPLIASYFGTIEPGKRVSFLQTLREFLVTPIFISFILGAAVALFLKHFDITGADLFTDFFTHFFTIINLSLTLLIWIAIGLMLKPMKITTYLPLLVMVVMIKMVIEPLVAVAFAGFTGISMVSYGLLLLECAVPSGAIASVMANRYGCDGSLAGWMVVGTYLVSMVTIPLFFLLSPI